MIRKIAAAVVIVFLFSINIHAQGFRYIEIYNINEQRVVKVMKPNKEIQNLAVNYLKNISGMYPKLNPIPNRGHAVKIPIEPSVKIQNKWLNADVDEVIVMFPENESPFLMAFETENKLLCFTFNGDTNKLLEALNYKIN